MAGDIAWSTRADVTAGDIAWFSGKAVPGDIAWIQPARSGA
ncbi:hypothetical protein [Streptomyces sp. NPDC001665]